MFLASFVRRLAVRWSRAEPHGAGRSRSRSHRYSLPPSGCDDRPKSGPNDCLLTGKMTTLTAGRASPASCESASHGWPVGPRPGPGLCNVRFTCRMVGGVWRPPLAHHGRLQSRARRLKGAADAGPAGTTNERPARNWARPVRRCQSSPDSCMPCSWRGLMLTLGRQ